MILFRNKLNQLEHEHNDHFFKSKPQASDKHLCRECAGNQNVDVAIFLIMMLGALFIGLFIGQAMTWQLMIRAALAAQGIAFMP